MVYTQTLNRLEQVITLKGRYDKKAFRRLLKTLLSLFDMHLSEIYISLKVPSGDMDKLLSHSKWFFIMSAFHFMQPMDSSCYFLTTRTGIFVPLLITPKATLPKIAAFRALLP